MLGSAVVACSATVLEFWMGCTIFSNFAVDSNPEVFGLRSHAEWRGVPNRCFSFSPGCAARTRKLEDSFTNLMWLTVVMMIG